MKKHAKRSTATAGSRILSSSSDVVWFKKAADAYVKRVTASPGTARKELVSMGIYTKSGRLTKNYSK